jgi:hypothetical protein
MIMKKIHLDLTIPVMIGRKTYRYLRNIMVETSILFNVILGGELHQSFSGRNYEREKNNKPNLCRIIDAIFGDYHCQDSWVHWKLVERKRNRG